MVLNGIVKGSLHQNSCPLIPHLPTHLLWKWSWRKAVTISWEVVTQPWGWNLLNTRKSLLSAQVLSASSHFEHLLNSFRWPVCMVPHLAWVSEEEQEKTHQSSAQNPYSAGKNRKIERKKGRSKLRSGTSMGAARSTWHDCGWLHTWPERDRRAQRKMGYQIQLVEPSVLKL